MPDEKGSHRNASKRAITNMI